MNWAQIAGDANDAIFAMFGVAGVYSPTAGVTQPVTVVIDDLREEFGFDSRQIDERFRVSFLVSELAAPSRGARLTVGTTVYVLGSILGQSDGVVEVSAR